MTFMTHRLTRTLVMAPLALGLAASLAACSGDTTGGADATGGATTTVALTPNGPNPAAALDLPRAVPAMADYDKRNNAAIKAARTNPDPKVWQAVDVGPSLEADAFDSRWFQLSDAAERAKPVVPFTLTPTAVISGAAGTLPTYTLVLGTTTKGGKTTTPAKTLDARVMVQQKANGPWLHAVSVNAPVGSLPKNVLPGSAVVQAPDDLARLASTSAPLVNLIENQVTPKGYSVGPLVKLRDALVADSAKDILTFSCGPLKADKVGAHVTWRLTDGTVYGMTSLRCSVNTRVRESGYYYNLPARTRALFKVTDKQPTSYDHPILVSLLVSMPPRPGQGTAAATTATASAPASSTGASPAKSAASAPSVNVVAARALDLLP